MRQEAAQQDFRKIASDVSLFRSTISPEDKTSQFFLYRLVIAVENASACALLAKNGFIVPLVTIERSIFESLISTYWASLSPKNVTIILDAESQELCRIMRKNLKNGRAQIRNKNTGAIETDRILDMPEVVGAKRPPKMDKMAGEAGIKNIYDMFYGMLSMWSHANATMMIGKELLASKRNESEPTIYASMCFVHACLKAIHLIVVNFIREKRPTKREEIEIMLNVKLSA